MLALLESMELSDVYTMSLGLFIAGCVTFIIFKILKERLTMAPIKKNRRETGTTITTKSPYGSHKEMIVDHEQFGLVLKENEVLLKDDVHYYTTTKDRLDTGLADANRYGKAGFSFDQLKVVTNE